MFDTKRIGKKIVNLRKINNITQMELADLMGVSYQAVSNWERGNSMPDISKLPELAKILNISIDDLLSEENSLDFIKKVIDSNEDGYLEEENVSIKEIAEIAPLLKPIQTEIIIDKVVENNKGIITIKEIAQIASSIDEDFLHKLIKQVNEKFTMEDLCELAPYIDESDLYKLALDAIKTDGVKGLERLAPFMDEDDLGEIVKKINDVDITIKLVPYLDEDYVGDLIINAAKAGNIDLVNKLAPYAEEDYLHDVADILVKKFGISGIKGIAPFL